jgi:hypothetical protein
VKKRQAGSLETAVPFHKFPNSLPYFVKIVKITEIPGTGLLPQQKGNWTEIFIWFCVFNATVHGAIRERRSAQALPRRSLRPTRREISR